MAMARLVLLAILVAALSVALQVECGGGRSKASHHAVMAAKHERWMARHGRVYKDEAEKARRLEVFKKNAAFVRHFHKNKAKANRTFTVRLNGFADLTLNEFRLAYTGGDVLSFSNVSRVAPTVSELSYNGGFDDYNGGYNSEPASFDWRTKGVVTPIKNQGSCGSCWAFAAVATIESLVKIKAGVLLSLSEQQLVDCNYNNGGCRGGDPRYAFEYVVQNGGITTEDTYPYTSGSQSQYNNGGYNGYNNGYNNDYSSGCDTSRASRPAVRIRGFQMVPQSQESLLQAVNSQPVATTIAVDGQDFMFYSGGIYNGGCAQSTNHVVTIVGYGTDQGYPYWLLKNSWGTRFGENGYMRILRNPGGADSHCGVGTYASYPTA